MTAFPSARSCLDGAPFDVAPALAELDAADLKIADLESRLDQAVEEAAELRERLTQGAEPPLPAAVSNAAASELGEGEWIWRAAARFRERSGVDEGTALQYAEATYRACLSIGFGDSTPEECADEEMACWEGNVHESGAP